MKGAKIGTLFLVSIMALAGTGLAFSTGMSFSNVGGLSLGYGTVPQINTDYIGYHLNSALYAPVIVDGVYISLDTSISGTNAVSVSLRAGDGSELCYYAANDVTWDAGTTYQVPMTADGDPLPGPDQVFYVKVTVAQNSQYN